MSKQNCKICNAHSHVQNACNKLIWESESYEKIADFLKSNHRIKVSDFSVKMHAEQHVQGFKESKDTSRSEEKKKRKGRPCSVCELPKEILEEVHKLLVEGKSTYDISKFLYEEKGISIYRQSISNHALKHLNGYKEFHEEKTKKKSFALPKIEKKEGGNQEKGSVLEDHYVDKENRDLTHEDAAKEEVALTLRVNRRLIRASEKNMIEYEKNERPFPKEEIQTSIKYAELVLKKFPDYARILENAFTKQIKDEIKLILNQKIEAFQQVVALKGEELKASEIIQMKERFNIPITKTDEMKLAKELGKEEVNQEQLFTEEELEEEELQTLEHILHERDVVIPERKRKIEELKKDLNEDSIN